MSLEATERLLQSFSDNDKVAGLIIAAKVLQADGSEEVAGRIARALRRGFLRKLLRNKEFRDVGLQVASTLAVRCSNVPDEVYIVLAELDGSRDDVDAVCAMLMAIAGDERVDLSEAIRFTSEVVEARRYHLEEEPVLSLVERLVRTQYEYKQEERERLAKVVARGLEQISESAEDTHTGRLLETAAIIATETSCSWTKALLTVLTRKPGRKSRAGSFSLFNTALTHEGLQLRSVEGWKAAELTLRLADVELRVGLKDVLNANSADAGKVWTKGEEMRDKIDSMVRCFRAFESMCEVFRDQETANQSGDVMLSAEEQAETACIKAVVEVASLIIEFAEAISDETEQALFSDSITDEVSQRLSDLTLAAARVLSCFLTLGLPVLRSESAKAINQFARVIDEDGLTLLLPGIMVLAEAPEVRPSLAERGLHKRLAEFAASRAQSSKSSEDDLNAATLALTALCNIIDTGSAIGPDNKMLSEVVHILKSALHHEMHEEVREQMEELVLTDELRSSRV